MPPTYGFKKEAGHFQFSVAVNTTSMVAEHKADNAAGRANALVTQYVYFPSVDFGVSVDSAFSGSVQNVDKNIDTAQNLDPEAHVRAVLAKSTVEQDDRLKEAKDAQGRFIGHALLRHRVFSFVTGAAATLYSIGAYNTVQDHHNPVWYILDAAMFTTLALAGPGTLATAKNRKLTKSLQGKSEQLGVVKFVNSSLPKREKT